MKQATKKEHKWKEQKETKGGGKDIPGLEKLNQERCLLDTRKNKRRKKTRTGAKQREGNTKYAKII